MKKNLIKLSSVEKCSLLTVAERLDILEEENVLLKTDIDDLRQGLKEEKEKVIRLEAESVLQKFKIRSLFGNLQSTSRLVMRMYNKNQKVGDLDGR